MPIGQDQTTIEAKKKKMKNEAGDDEQTAISLVTGRSIFAEVANSRKCASTKQPASSSEFNEKKKNKQTNTYTSNESGCVSTLH